jgi:hypothetical protein
LVFEVGSTERFEKVFGAHDERAHAATEIANAVIAGDGYSAESVFGLIDRAFNESVGAEVARGVDDFETGDARHRAGWVGVGGLPVEDDRDALAGLATKFDDEVYEGFAPGFKVGVESGSQFGGFMDDIVAVYVIVIRHGGEGLFWTRVWGTG